MSVNETLLTIMTSPKRSSPSITAKTRCAANKTLGQIHAQFAHDPDNVLDMLMEQCGLKYDNALARMLGVAPTVISRIRRGRLSIGPALLVRILEITDARMSDLQKRLARRQS